ncbi:MAG: molybdenum cofactor biosynthesis protein [Bacilli bacterium]
MRVTVRLFAAAAEAAGFRRLEMEWPDGQEVRLADVRTRLADSCPSLQALLSRAWFARGQEYATLETRVEDGDDIAVIPPVSGGRDSDPGPKTEAGSGENGEIAALAAVVAHELRPEAMYSFVLRRTAGAVVVFAGTAREFTKGRQTLYLRYEAYADMAIKQMEDIAAACQARWPGATVALWHRVGRLEITDISVLIGVSAPHRKDAFAAAQYAIDTLKQTVPIWKKEFYADGEIEWRGPDEPWRPAGDA